MRWYVYVIMRIQTCGSKSCDDTVTCSVCCILKGLRQRMGLGNWAKALAIDAEIPWALAQMESLLTLK